MMDEDYTGAHARAALPLIYTNDTIMEMGRQARWTVSDNTKRPIDMRHLLDGCGPSCRHSDPVRGAWANDERCLVTLDELTDELPLAANRAFWLRCTHDGVMMVDIEKTCPPAEAARLLAGLGPSALYAERSLSGRGFHLLMPLPANMWQYPVAATSVVLKHPEGWWEILLEHWVTFTGDPIGSISDLGAPGAPIPSWEDVYAEVASVARERPALDLDISAQRPTIHRGDQLLEIVTRNAHKKTPADYGQDMSRFEFAVMGVLYNRITTVFEAVEQADPSVSYDIDDRVWMLYDAAVTMLPHRPKHEEARNGVPLLMNSAAALVAQRMAESETKGER